MTRAIRYATMEILRAEVADKVAQLEPLIRLAPADAWRPTFEQAAAAWRMRANGCPEMSDARREYLGWALAHEFILQEQQGGTA
jgi:hypothetical protein